MESSLSSLTGSFLSTDILSAISPAGTNNDWPGAASASAVSLEACVMRVGRAAAPPQQRGDFAKPACGLTPPPLRESSITEEKWCFAHPK